MQQTGFVDLTEEEVETQEIFPNGADYVDHYFAMAAPMKPLFEALSEERRNEVRERLTSAAEEYRQGDRIVIPRVVLIVSGKRPPK